MNALFESLADLSFEDPAFLWLALAVGAGLVVRGLRGAPALLFAPFVLLDGPAAGAGPNRRPLPSSLRVRLRPLARCLEVAGLLLLIVAVARPVRRNPLPLTTLGIDIILCLDISSSMAADDLEAGRTRLDIARESALRFIAGRPSDRIGLVTFARWPDLRAPLTLDHDALAATLSAVTLVPRDGPEDATGIGAALALAVRSLRDAGRRSRVVILLTDGEENVATGAAEGEIAPVHAGQLAQDLGARVYTIAAGAGTPDGTGGRIPIDTREVRSLSERTGGRFFEVRDPEALDTVYTSIDDLERAEVATPRHRIEERFAPFLGAGIVLLILARALAATVFRSLP